jgi:hypothetical protein
MKNRFVITLAPRQIGKTTVFTVYCLWYALFQFDKSKNIGNCFFDIAKIVFWSGNLKSVFIKNQKLFGKYLNISLAIYGTYVEDS